MAWSVVRCRDFGFLFSEEPCCFRQLLFLLHGIYPADVPFLPSVTQKSHADSLEKRTVSSDHLYSGYFHLLTTRPWDGNQIFLRL